MGHPRLDLMRRALYWWAASLTAALIWSRTGILVFLAAAAGFLCLAAVWTRALALASR